MININSEHFEQAMPWLCNAIIEQASIDYRLSRIKLADPTLSRCKRRNALKMKNDCERFFESDRTQHMTKADVSGIYYLLRTETLEDAAKHLGKNIEIEL